ncbi:translational GTPase TypA [Bacillaceae bacterium SIJ1]|uniref:translational GTPase TypA n=1 Tax=Litoribacterium kuwaitense TaxID=1398745 RepID=UPI0013EC7959|nr:translational GTPase TypA [Litoribacterium kuwaitense]NGP44389.1 translational GTPase TypA [Litoribacterium kuwaitense]
MNKRNDIRNIAIIAHVDHGKTTLVDQMLHQSGLFRDNEHVEERAMDSNDIEKERGITILSKNTAVRYGETKMNILDTPGHADFGGEVERIMRMVDGVLLVVDAYEGCMPQTRFVLKKALDAGLTPVVVVNKMDRPEARAEEVVDEVLELFIELDANDDQLDFPVIYASGIKGIATNDLNESKEDVKDLFEAIMTHVPSPDDTRDEPLQFQVSLLDYNDYVGRICIGRIFKGVLKQGQTISLTQRDGRIVQGKVAKLYGFEGLKRLEIAEAGAGDLVAIAGVQANVGDTVSLPGHEDPLPVTSIDEPTLQMTFHVNDSPFVGREGKFVTARKIEERLDKQLETDVSLRVKQGATPDEWIVSGRGELHLSILIENLRREGYELAVAKPEVIVREVDGVRSEPFEQVHIEVPEEFTGAVMESLGERKGEMSDMTSLGERTQLQFIVPSRALIGYRTEFLTMTKGMGIMHHSFKEYRPVVTGYTGGRRRGVLVNKEPGKSTQYGILQVEDRGIVFVEPGIDLYEGMIVGEHSRENDLTVNITRAKQMTNVRSATKDQTQTMRKTRDMSLEEALEYMEEDELCEVTPEAIRLRKKILSQTERERYEKRRKKALSDS